MIIHYKDVALEGHSDTIAPLTILLSKGEFCLLTGDHDSGISSLMKSMYGAHKIISGSAQVLGIQLSTISDNDRAILRRQVGVMLGTQNLIDTITVSDILNIVLESKGITENKSQKELSDSILNQLKISSLSHTLITSLTLLQKQRLSLAMALINKPKLLLIYDPLLGQDNTNHELLMDVIFDMASVTKMTTLIVSHDPLLMKSYPCRTLLMQDLQI